MRRYTGYTYVKKLERCLRKISYEERLDAVNYYSEYLAEAGPEREREVIERLGPPQRVAAEIRADAALRELNAREELYEKTKLTKRAAKKNRRNAGRARYKVPDEAYTGGTGVVGAGVVGVADADAAYASGTGGAYAGGADTAYANTASSDTAYADGIGGEDARHRFNQSSPRIGKSISAAGLGAIGMLAMPGARPLAVLACVLGIIGLVLGVIVVVTIFAVAGGLAVGGVISLVASLFLIPQDTASAILFAGAGLAFVGAGLVVGVLNYLLGRAIFKGIANLSGRIRHRRVKVRKETFNYAYTGGAAYPYGPAKETDGGAAYPYESAKGADGNAEVDDGSETITAEDGKTGDAENEEGNETIAAERQNGDETGTEGTQGKDTEDEQQA